MRILDVVTVTEIIVQAGRETDLIRQLAAAGITPVAVASARPTPGHVTVFARRPAE